MYRSLATLLGSVLGSVCLLAATSAAQADNNPLSTTSLDQQVEEVVDRLEGVMDTSAQAANNPKSANVRMTTCRIRLADARSTDKPVDSSVFLYQEQAITNSLSQPYRQRFLQISSSPYSQSVRSRSYRPANASSWVNFCDKPIADRVIQTNDLGSAVCNVFLKRVADSYVGNTPIDGCPAKVRGAVRITNRIMLHQTGMDTWDRGFDQAGKQVWGAQTESYQFRRQN